MSHRRIVMGGVSKHIVSCHSTLSATHDEGRLDGRDVGLKERMGKKERVRDW